MSNQVVGGVYAQIIDRIIVEAKNDFEEAGLEQETLQELKQKWQQNISNLHIAHCPWDPPPPVAQVQNPPTLPSNVKSDGYKGEYKPEQANGPPSLAQQQTRNGLHADPQIKQEVKYEPMPTYPNGYQQGGLNSMSAQQRSHQLLQQQFGTQANASIQAMQQQQQQQQHQRQGISLPQQQHQQRPNNIQLPAQNQRPPQQPYSQQPSSLGASQTDGAGDDAQATWTAMLVERRARSEDDRHAADDMFKAYLEQQAAATENGLMMPLSEHPSTKAKKRKAASSSQPTVSSIPYPSSHPRLIPQMDGGDDDEEVKPKIEADEDAINSDLDDSDDELDNPDDDDEDGAGTGETILCTYDKVQRVKNKWKCTLKDGILTTGGKEYVFHKAQGEFEW